MVMFMKESLRLLMISYKSLSPSYLYDLPPPPVLIKRVFLRDSSIRFRYSNSYVFLAYASLFLT